MGSKKENKQKKIQTYKKERKMLTIRRIPYVSKVLLIYVFNKSYSCVIVK